MNIRVRVVIRGLVQGVSFRHYTMMTARTLGVTGWVANRPDGNVEGCFEGEETAVQALVDWCRTGPAYAGVEAVEVSREPFRGDFEDFSIRR